jgi:ankyrin repeat protein
LEVFVRKNDPSRLFRRTRILLSNYGEGPSPLHEAIENGHTDIALSLIEQLLDMPSPNRLLENENEALLLIAAKFNQWKIMELILKNRSDLIHQTDKDGNNLLHLLTNINDDKGVETIDKLLKTFPSDIKILLNEENNQHQTPMNISQSNGNTQSYDLLTSFLNCEKNEI